MLSTSYPQALCMKQNLKKTQKAHKIENSPLKFLISVILYSGNAFRKIYDVNNSAFKIAIK